MNLLILWGFLSGALGQEPFQVDQIEKGQIQFVVPKDGTPKPKDLKTNLFELSHVGYLGANAGKVPPFLLLEGLECEGCTSDRFLYLIRADGEGEPLRLIYPGRVTDRKTGEVLMIARSFFGQCLSGKKDVYVAFLQEKLRRRKYLQSSVFVAEVVDGHVEEQLIIRRPPQIQNTLSRVKRKECVEIPGKDRKSQTYQIPKPPEKETE